MAFEEETSEVSTNSTSVLDTEEVEVLESSAGIKWNLFTATGWIGCFFGLINLVLFLPCIFKEHNIAAKEAQYQKRNTNDQTSKFPKPDYMALIVVLYSFFVSQLIYVLLETLMVPMTMDLYAWTDAKAITVVGVGLSIAGGVCFVVFVAIRYVSKFVDERIIVISGVVIMALAMIIFMPMGSNYAKIKNCPSTDLMANHDNRTLSISDAFHSVSLPDIGGKVNNMSTNSRNVSLRRRRRHVTHSGGCEDTGCPPEQDWCINTPIIEMSQMGLGSFLAIVGFPIVNTIAGTMYSKLLGPKPQGLWMGLLICVGGLSRVIGPISVSYVYTELGTQWTFGILLVVMCFTTVVNLLMYKRLVPMKILDKR